jgi:hypothetical protein
VTYIKHILNDDIDLSPKLVCTYDDDDNDDDDDDDEERK